MGAAASTIPSQIDKETFRRLAGSDLNDAVFDRLAVNGVITRDALVELSKTTDVYLACDRGLERGGKQTHQRVIGVNRGLRKRGIVTRFDEAVTPGGALIANMYDAVDKARTCVIFLSSSYCSKVAVADSSSSTDHAQMEFNYIIKRKRPHHVIFAIMEEQLLSQDPRFVPPAIRAAMGASRCVDFSSDASFEARCDALFNAVAEALAVREEGEQRPTATQAAMHNTINPYPQTQALLPVEAPPPRGLDVLSDAAQELVQQMRRLALPRTREEVQLYQWLERSTNISESRRVVYVSSFLRAGLTSVKLLASRMIAQQDFLVGAMGLSDFDADEIALAVRDLGLGSVPETDFSIASSLESASYAMHKALQERTNHRMAANALACVARIAGSSRDLPAHMGESRFCESVVKLLGGHMDDAAAVEHGCRAMLKLAQTHAPNATRLRVLGVADLLPKLAVRHLANAAVMETLFHVVGVLCEDVELRRKFGVSGMCELLAKALATTVQAEVCAERACFAVAHLTYETYDNVWKLGNNGICDLLVQCLARHPHNSLLVRDGFLAFCHLTTFEENRKRFASPGVAATLVTAARTHLANPEVAELACAVMYSNVYGVAFNNKLMGEGGACEFIREALVEYCGLPQTSGAAPPRPPHVGVLKEACAAIGVLAAGNPVNQSKFDGLRQLTLAIAGNHQFPDETKKAAQVAASRLR